MISKEKGRQEYFQSAISVNCVLFSYFEKDLKILVIERNREPFFEKKALPGGLVFPDEDLDVAAEKIISGNTSLFQVHKNQLKAFADTNRHPLGRVITVSYYSAVRHSEIVLKDTELSKNGTWFSFADIPELSFDHSQIVKTAILRLKSDIRYRTRAFNLLENEFTLPQLQNLYEVVLGIELDKRNFRRKLSVMKFIEETGEVQKSLMYRPAKLYRFNPQTFMEWKMKGNVFSL